LRKVRFIDLFCGIGGFRLGTEQALAARNLHHECVFSSDIDSFAQDMYEANFGERPAGDIKAVNPADIPDHDVLLAGFPCQPFSIIGSSKGFEDTRGTLLHALPSSSSTIRPLITFLSGQALTQPVKLAILP
jgi:DNA (cytosine-5)-methyltransferase 1